MKILLTILLLTSSSICMENEIVDKKSDFSSNNNNIAPNNNLISVNENSINKNSDNNLDDESNNNLNDDKFTKKLLENPTEKNILLLWRRSVRNNFDHNYLWNVVEIAKSAKIKLSEEEIKSSIDYAKKNNFNKSQFWQIIKMAEHSEVKFSKEEVENYWDNAIKNFSCEQMRHAIMLAENLNFKLSEDQIENSWREIIQQKCNSSVMEELKNMTIYSEVKLSDDILLEFWDKIILEKSDHKTFSIATEMFNFSKVIISKKILEKSWIFAIKNGLNECTLRSINLMTYNQIKFDEKTIIDSWEEAFNQKFDSLKLYEIFDATRQSVVQIPSNIAEWYFDETAKIEERINNISDILNISEKLNSEKLLDKLWDYVLKKGPCWNYVLKKGPCWDYVLKKGPCYEYFYDIKSLSEAALKKNLPLKCKIHNFFETLISNKKGVDELCEIIKISMKVDKDTFDCLLGKAWQYLIDLEKQSKYYKAHDMLKILKIADSGNSKLFYNFANYMIDNIANEQQCLSFLSSILYSKSDIPNEFVGNIWEKAISNKYSYIALDYIIDVAKNKNIKLDKNVLIKLINSIEKYNFEFKKTMNVLNMAIYCDVVITNDLIKKIVIASINNNFNFLELEKIFEFSEKHFANFTKDFYEKILILTIENSLNWQTEKAVYNQIIKSKIVFDKNFLDELKFFVAQNKYKISNISYWFLENSLEFDNLAKKHTKRPINILYKDMYTVLMNNFCSDFLEIQDNNKIKYILAYQEGHKISELGSYCDKNYTDMMIKNYDKIILDTIFLPINKYNAFYGDMPKELKNIDCKVARFSFPKNINKGNKSFQMLILKDVPANLKK